MAKEKKETSTGGSSDGDARLRVRTKKVERYRTAGLVALQLVIITILFLQVNYLSCRRHTTWDLTTNKRFTLSDTSTNYLNSMSGEVRLIMAFLGTSELYPEVKGLLSEFDRVGGDSVVAEFLDLSRSRSRLAELQDQYRLRFGGDQIVILGETGRTKVIAAEELVTRDANTGRIIEFKGEEVVTSALLEVVEQQQRKVYLVAGGRRADELVPIAQQLQPLANAQNARIESIVLEGRSALPDDADALFFAGNTSDVSEREAELIRDYFERSRGGLVIFRDPGAETPNFDQILRELGVSPNRDRVLSVISLGGLQPRRISDVPVSLMPGGGPTRDLPALSVRLLGRTNSFEVLYEDDLLLSENIRPRPLMVAGEGFWGETEYQAEEISFNPDLDQGTPDLVFTAASVEKGLPGDPDLSEGSSRLVVVGNPDLIAPDGNTSKVAADFTMASLNWVMNREALMGISPRRPTAFTLNISPDDFGLLQSLTIFLMPGVALIVGGLVWLKRRA